MIDVLDTIVTDQLDCFARINETTCNALNKKECRHCRFYQHKAYIKNNPFYAYSYSDLKQLKKDISKRNIKIEEVVW